jgi:adenine deaminase
MSDRKMLDEMSETRKAGKVIGGHYASPDLGRPFHGYVAGGPEDDHEGTRMEDAIARVRQGMKPMLRLGSAWHDVAAQARAITEKKIDSHRFILCTDDSHAETLSREGHMDRVLKYAINSGLKPMTALQMMTVNTAEHFGLSREIGMIAPGRWADIVLTRNLRRFNADLVIARGAVIAEKGRLVVDLAAWKYPQWVTRSVRLKRALRPEDFALKANVADGSRLLAHVIGVIENQAPTRHLRLQVGVNNREVRPDLANDLAKVSLVERHRASGKVTVGLVSGFGFTERCAVATTVAHDSHHLIIVGTDEVDMALAGNKLAEVGGGQIVVKEGKVIGLVDLPIAGLMSTERVEQVARKADTVLEGFRSCGCALNNPNMQLSLLALVVIPELRISDKGLVDVSELDFVPALEAL